VSDCVRREMTASAVGGVGVVVVVGMVVGTLIVCAVGVGQCAVIPVSTSNRKSTNDERSLSRSSLSNRLFSIPRHRVDSSSSSSRRRHPPASSWRLLPLRTPPPRPPVRLPSYHHPTSRPHTPTLQSAVSAPSYDPPSVPGPLNRKNTVQNKHTSYSNRDNLLRKGNTATGANSPPT
jgi:hypothetical protein